MSNTIGASERILEQWNLWWRKSKHHEQHANQADYGEGKQWALAWQPISLKRPPLKEKDYCGGDVEDGDIDPIRGFAEHAVVGVEQHRDQHQSKQNLR